MRKAKHFITLSEPIECLKKQGLVIDNEEGEKNCWSHFVIIKILMVIVFKE